MGNSNGYLKNNVKIDNVLYEKKFERTIWGDLKKLGEKIAIFLYWLWELSLKLISAIASIAHSRGHIMAYVAAALALATVAIFIGFAAAPESNHEGTSNFQKRLKRTLKTWLMPSYKTKMFFNNLSLYSGEVPTTERQEIAGRCDNLTMREVLKNGTGLCVKTSRPEPLVWIMDADNMPELSGMDTTLRSKITGSSGEKFTVIIPWSVYKEDGMNYYPDCSKAVFSDGTSASNLFKDDGIKSCNIKKILPTTYTEKARPVNNNYKGLTAYSTEKKPLC